MRRPHAVRPMRRRLAFALAAAVVVTQPGLPADAAPYVRPGAIEMITPASGENPVGGTTGARIDGSGRYVAFTSLAANFVPGDRNNSSDAFVKDRRTGRVERVSVQGGRDGGEAYNTLADAMARQGPGGGGRADSMVETISRNGRYVVFRSCADNLAGYVVQAGKVVPRDTNLASDVFVRDRLTGRTELVSVSTRGTMVEPSPNTEKPTELSGQLCSGVSAGGAISDDGRFVVFNSKAGTLASPPSPKGVSQAYLRDRVKETTTRISVSPEGVPGIGGHSYGTAITGNGRYAVISSAAGNLVAGDTNGDTDVFVRDLRSNKTERVSVDYLGRQLGAAGAAGYSSMFAGGNSISADGNLVAFYSFSTAAPTRSTVWGDIYLRDRKAKRTERISVGSAGQELMPGGLPISPHLSRNGRWVTWSAPEIYQGRYLTARAALYDRVTGTFEHLPVRNDGSIPPHQPGQTTERESGFMSDDGRFVALGLYRNITDRDLYQVHQVYVRDRGVDVSVTGLRHSRRSGKRVVSGVADFGGRVIATRGDKARDSRKEVVGERGQDLVGASVTYQREDDQLMFRWRVRDLPVVTAPGPRGGVPVPGLPDRPDGIPDPLPDDTVGIGGSIAGDPLVLYRFRFTAAGKPWEVRARLSATAVAVPPTRALFELYQCGETELSCERKATLKGGLGTYGLEVRTAVPLGALGIREGGRISGIRAQTVLYSPALGTVPPGTPVPGVLDDVRLTAGAVQLPVGSVKVTITSPNTPRRSPLVVRPVLSAGRFRFEFSEWATARGRYTAVFRTCFGSTCRTQRVAV